MAMFGSKRDINMFRGINREVIHKINDTSVDVYKLNINKTDTNIYGESLQKYYSEPVRINCMISTDEQDTTDNEYGVDKNRIVRFYFLRDDLVDIDLKIEIGDYINWDNRIWELDTIIDNKYFMQRNQETNKNYDDSFGWNIKISFEAHESQLLHSDLTSGRYNISREEH